MSAIPLADAPAFRLPARRTAAVLAALAAAGVLAAVAFLLLSRNPHTRTIVPLPTHADTVLVLDVSASISTDTYSRIGGTLAALSRSGGRFGLVIFSDEAYEALPPGVPATDLAPFVRYFTLPQQVRPGFAVTFPPNPWQATFSGGTRISAGMDLAHSIAVGEPAPRDRRARQRPRRQPGRPEPAGDGAAVVPSRQRAGADRRAESVRGRSCALPAAASARARRSSPRRRSSQAPPHDHTPFPWALVALTLVAAAALALRWAWAPRLDWSEQVRPLRLVLAGLLVARGRGRRAARGRRPRVAVRARERRRRSTPRRRVVRRGRRRPGSAASRKVCSAPATTSAQRRALQLYTLAGALPQRLDDALEVQTARAQAQDALATAARDPDPQRAAQARTLLGILTFGTSSSGGSSNQVDAADRRLHRRDPGRSGRGLREVRSRAAAAVDRRARHAYRAGPGQRRRPDRTSWRGRRRARERVLMTFLTPLAGLVALAAAASARGRRLRPHPRRRRAPRARPGGGFGARRPRPARPRGRGSRPARPRRRAARAGAPLEPAGAEGRRGAVRARHVPVDGGVGDRDLADAARPCDRAPPPGCARPFRRFRRAWPR